MHTYECVHEYLYTALFSAFATLMHYLTASKVYVEVLTHYMNAVLISICCLKDKRLYIYSRNAPLLIGPDWFQSCDLLGQG